MTTFPHPSRPGYYRITFSEHLRDSLSMLASGLIPGGTGYPSGGDAQVATFIEDRASEPDRQLLETIVGRCDVTSPESAAATLAELESTDPSLFAWLREFVYHGYYASRRVLAAMADRGYAYHGAPQPLGYAIDVEPVVPTVRRGSYIPTAEVTRAAD
jgi:hypothetical protein